MIMLVKTTPGVGGVKNILGCIKSPLMEKLGKGVSIILHQNKLNSISYNLSEVR